MMKAKALAIYIIMIFLIFVSLPTIYSGDLSLKIVALISFITVIISALLISFATESAQFLVSQGLAVAVVALLQVLPEFMVEAVISWEGKVSLITANLTGSNRLLMGGGWALVFFTAIWKKEKNEKWYNFSIKLRKEAIIESFTLFIVSFYYIFILIKGTLSFIDSIILAPTFFFYIYLLFRLPPEKEEEIEYILLPAREVTKIKSKRIKGMIVSFLFLIGGVSLLLVAHPFLDGMEELSISLGISTFVFVQWLAPFLTEFPEKLSAFYWARTGIFAPMGLLNMISSVVNQWTLLVAMVPIIYLISPKGGGDIHLDGHQQEEIFLSMVMVIYGAVLLFKRNFTFFNVICVFSLWLLQFIFPHRFSFVEGNAPFFDFPEWLFHSWRGITSLLFILLTFIEFIRYFKGWKIIDDLKYSIDLMKKK